MSRSICAVMAAMFLLSDVQAVAASFDCRRARTADEVAICDNRDLNDMDVRMATLFEITKGFVAMGERGAMQDEQRDWLDQRRRCGGDVPCLRRSYRRRIGELEDTVRDIKSRGPF